jgi:hypothetical protein
MAPLSESLECQIECQWPVTQYYPLVLASTKKKQYNHSLIADHKSQAKSNRDREITEQLIV